MKVVILAGGFGTRLSEETALTPKPMVQIGGAPILWHIMKSYASFGFREFVVALGYKGEVIKNYFLHYGELAGDLTVDLDRNVVTQTRRPHEDWVVHLVDTGLNTLTGGRLRRLAPLLGGETFMLTYGDGVSDVDPNDVLALHRGTNALATVTAVRPPARFGGIQFDGDRVTGFAEKRQTDEGWINGGFMVMEPAVMNYLSSDKDVLEVDLLERLAADGGLVAYRHEKFWQCMDTVRDRHTLEQMWDSGQAPWKRWDR
ncbi:glucose-1-phosphate cytidylyltransferase [Aurantimonas sp. MSK8Z-1]|uniref:glucose-1-phosphate cytidylyltransferase n=1 Tax=Mangrovibrevibacter kandeliae TaxID=2968473 RepID=UPI002117F416|nr:glucose-1-phosphate cytidylyltransferase [Aurantimonas sp. MSK8Z-1]MCW4116995.1 glucose-1-phosphate cytidylyltransferase [Aurantimonas sp. MSK8Z-1]